MISGCWRYMNYQEYFRVFMVCYQHHRITRIEDCNTHIANYQPLSNLSQKCYVNFGFARANGQTIPRYTC